MCHSNLFAYLSLLVKKSYKILYLTFVSLDSHVSSSANVESCFKVILYTVNTFSKYSGIICSMHIRSI